MRLARNVAKLMGEYGHFGSDENIDVSVVIPAYNEEKNIGYAIESVLDQGYRASQIIVVDDGSSDDTSEVADSYEGVKILKTENMGISHARNYGSDNADGDIIIWMDADSMMESGLLQEVVDNVRKGYVGGTARTTANTNGIGENIFYSAQNAVAAASTAISNVLGVDMSPVSDGGFSYCIRESLDKIRAKYGDPIPDYAIGEDREFVKRMAEEGPVARITNTGIVTDSRRIRKDGLAKTTVLRFKDYATPPSEAKKRTDVRLAA